MSYAPLPAGYRAVPFEENAGGFSWRLAIVVRESGRPELVSLANVPDARAFLGCVLDSRNMVREWLEIWVQNLEDLNAADTGFEDQLSSEQLDRRWHHHWQATSDLTPGAVVMDVPEDQLRPLYLDPGRWRIVQPTNPEGAAWALCRDDQKLAQAGLPKYTQSTSRYLCAAVGAGANRFVAADSRAPLKETALQRSPELGFDAPWLSINPQGGHMAFRVRPPMDFEDYLDLLGGATVAQVSSRKSDCEAALLRSCLAAAERDGRRHGLMLSGNGVAELFYLKLRLLLQSTRAVARHLRETQCPLLNLDPSSFGISLAEGEELPWAWTTTCQLMRPGRAMKFKIPESDEIRFVAVGESGATAYCPAGRSRRGDLMATVQPLRVIIDEQQRVCIEGKLRLASPEPVDLSDVIGFRFSQGHIPGEFCGTVVAEGPAVRREIEFRTWPRALGAQETAQVKRLEGGKIERCWSEIIPALSSPYDLNSLSILGARALLVHEKNPLPEVVDELERLGRATSEQLPPGSSFEQVVSVLRQLAEAQFASGALTCSHLFGTLPDPPKDPDIVPPQLWAEALTILIRLMPGLGAVSQCPDYGTAPGGGLDGPVQEPLEALERLCARARSLVFSDWQANREMQRVLAELRQNW